ncbi:MAG: HlyD family secretion protein, partial [Syntrophomonadaceae bacterium]
MKGVIKGVVVLVLLSLAAIGSYLVYKEYHSQQVDLIQATGTIEATTVDLTAKTSGTLANLFIQEGGKVSKGQLVAELTRNDLVAQRERDAMAVLAAETRLSDLLSGARVQEIKEAAANVNVAKITYEQSLVEYNRLEALFKEGAVSQQELDKAKENVEVKRNQLDAADARLSLLEAGNRPQVLAEAQAEVQRNKAILQATDSLLQDLKILSPISGTVLSKNYEPGEFVQTGASLATVADLTKLWVKVYIPTDDLPAIKMGQKVRFTVSGDKTQYTGTVTYIASQGEFTP